MRRLFSYAPASITVSAFHCLILASIISTGPNDASILYLRIPVASVSAIWFAGLASLCERHFMFGWRHLLMIYAGGFGVQALMGVTYIGQGPISFWGVNLSVFIAAIFAIYVIGWRNLQSREQQ